MRQKRNYDKRVLLNKLQESDWVWYFYPPKAKQKLGQGWTGPFLITRKISEVLFQIQASSLSRPKIVHIDNLRRYEAEEMPTDWRLETDNDLNEDEVVHCNESCLDNDSPQFDGDKGMLVGRSTSKFGRVRRIPNYLNDYCC